MLTLKDQTSVHALRQDDGVATLPFPAPTFWWLNGKGAYAEQKDARYYGGWATSADDLEAFCAEVGAQIPPHLRKVMHAPKEGDPIAVYAARSLTIVPIARRLSSVDKVSGTRVPGYAKGASPHLQTLVYIAYASKAEKATTRVDFGPAVLSVKGFQVGYFLETFREWSRLTAQARRESATGIPANFFFMTVGTFGDKPNVLQVGKQSKSPITPIELYKPKVVDEPTLRFLFVGDLEDTLVNLRRDAQEWIDAWGKATGATQGTVPDAPDDAIGEEEVEIPF